jgi:hypothetical protein
VPVGIRHSEPVYGVALEIEFDHDGGLIADYPSIVSRLDGDDLGRRELQRAPIGISNVNLTAGEVSDVRVHAQVGAGDGFHVLRPAKSRRVDEALDTAGAGANDIDLDATDDAGFGAVQGRQQVIAAHEDLR